MLFIICLVLLSFVASLFISPVDLSLMDRTTSRAEKSSKNRTNNNLVIDSTKPAGPLIQSALPVMKSITNGSDSQSNNDPLLNSSLPNVNQPVLNFYDQRDINWDMDLLPLKYDELTDEYRIPKRIDNQFKQARNYVMNELKFKKNAAVANLKEPGNVERCTSRWIPYEYLSSGAYGAVWSGCEVSNRHKCGYVIKVQHDKTGFEKEIYFSNLLSDTDVIPKIYDFFQCKESYYIVMQKCTGTAAEYLNRHMNDRNRNDIYREFNDAMVELLIVLHDKGIVHGDLHYSNIMFIGNIVQKPSHLYWKIIDFAKARKTRKLGPREAEMEAPNARMIYALDSQLILQSTYPILAGNPNILPKTFHDPRNYRLLQSHHSR